MWGGWLTHDVSWYRSFGEVAYVRSYTSVHPMESATGTECRMTFVVS